MSVPRTLARRLLAAVLRCAPEESHLWATAMLRELDFIEGEWAALFWALGSTTAIFRHAVSVWHAWLTTSPKENTGMNNTGKKSISIAIGAVSTLMLLGCAFAALRIISLVFPGLDLDHSPWAYWLAILAIPEAIFVAATILLWRKKGPVAAGILATGLVVVLHVAAHLAMHRS